ncbi:uncharacterized protein N7477_001932 [Penicillium maclennaniae]|uniref:uncharacterized protein n=1 Tax=Penicillium maclennaniae TaxID=1343394 RepID=UPI002541D6E8|nr:uncharacterized protein N7477_001932 [Penicillium maclennaniae]KAJ5681992.1 hypothetical protein N7477_001932 [Penicillium maclennaniae]
MGGPSGADHDGGFTPMSPNVHTHTEVNEYSKDDHSIRVKNKDVFHPHAAPMPYGVAMAPGMGPFSKAGGKRSWPQGGTAMGGPSGDDEGQVFDMPITGNFYTSVDEESTDDHSIKLQNENVCGSPAQPPVSHPPPDFVHAPQSGSGFGEAAEGAPKHYNVPAEAFEKRWGYEGGGTAMGGPSGGDGPSDGPEDFPYPVQAGGTALGGPSGEDDGINFDNGIHADFHTNVKEYSHDDHSIDIKHTDIYPPPPFPPFGAPIKRSWVSEQGGWERESGGTAMGGPSGNDGGQEFNMPITINTETSIKESYADDHSIDIKHKDVYPYPAAFPEFGGPGPVIPEGGESHFKRAYSPSEDRTGGGGGGGTAEGGPSGEDDGINFSDPTDVSVDSNVSEHHEDNHSIKIDDTHVHQPQMPWMPYQGSPAPKHEQSPPAPQHEESSACTPEIHNIVQTVTKTATQVVQETATVTETPKDHIVDHVQTIHETYTVTETPAAQVVAETHTVYVTPSEHVVHVTDTVTAPAPHVVQATVTVYVSPSHVVETVCPSPSHIKSEAVPSSQGAMVTPVSQVVSPSTMQSVPVSAAPSSSSKAQASYNFHPQAPSSDAYSMTPVSAAPSPSSMAQAPSSDAYSMTPVSAAPSSSSMAQESYDFQPQAPSSDAYSMTPVSAAPSPSSMAQAPSSDAYSMTPVSAAPSSSSMAQQSYDLQPQAPSSDAYSMTPVSAAPSSSSMAQESYDFQPQAPSSDAYSMTPVSAAPSSSSMAQESYDSQSQAPTSHVYSTIPVDVPMASASSAMATEAMPTGVDAMQSSMPFASATPSHDVYFTGNAARLSGGFISAAAAVMGVLAFIL